MTKLPSLNGLRALSILFVIFSHLDVDFSIFSTTILTDGQFGVNVFFVISGFIITLILLEEESSFGKIDVKKFYLRRMFRILPAYYFVLIVYFLFTIFHVFEISNESWLTALTFTKYLNWQKDWFTSNSWSLSIEEQFYLIFPLIFLQGRKVRVILFVSIIVICPFFRLFDSSTSPYLFNGFTILQRLDAIAIGCLIAVFRRELIVLINHWKNGYLFFSIGWILLFPYFSKYHVHHYLPFSWAVLPMIGSNGTITILVISFIVLYSTIPSKSYWYWFLNHPVMDRIGIFSFSIYLWQQLFTSHLWFGRSFFPYNLLFIAIAALFSYYIIEKPFLRLKEHFVVRHE